MTLRNEVDQYYIFDEKIRLYEEKLVKFSLEIGKQRGQNPNITRILTYLLIHGRLTQKQLKELTNSSIGSISTHLAALISIGFVEKKLIPGTHTNMYSLKIDLGQNISSLMKMGMEYINQAKEFLTSKKIELNKIFNKKKNKHKSILDRFEELEYVLELYIHLFKQMFSSEELDLNIPIRKAEVMDNLQEFDDDTKIIEKEIIEFFTYTPMFFGKSEIFSKTFAYFLTRKFLTQRKLRELTGLSTGKISQEINTLLELEIIKKDDISETGQITYQMKSVTLAFLQVSFNVLSEFMKWKAKIENVNSELEEQKPNLRYLHGYDEILNVAKIFLRILPFYEKAYKFVLEIRKKLEVI